MIYLEMSRVAAHGGGAWGFPNCIWAPTQKTNGGRWPFWEKVKAIREGDIVIHLRGTSPQAFFVGYSRASSNGFETTERPPEAGDWSYATSFYRADLADYTRFHKPVNLTSLFIERREHLEAYFTANRLLGSEEKKHLFFVKQSGRLQCLNGAYLSEVDANLFDALFGHPALDKTVHESTANITVETGWQLNVIQSRIGQAEFSRQLKKLYGYRCCFPGCFVSDRRFLVASHIARWADNEKLRGHLGNGLCLCLMHDKAFELGIFTLDSSHRVHVNPRDVEIQSEIAAELLKSAGQSISKAPITPLSEALQEHQIRVNFKLVTDEVVSNQAGD